MSRSLGPGVWLLCQRWLLRSSAPAGGPSVGRGLSRAARRESTALLDAAVWVQSDFREAERRATLRSGGDAAAIEQTRDWMTEELPFLAADRPWERATIIVAGTPDVAYDSVSEVVIAMWAS